MNDLNNYLQTEAETWTVDFIADYVAQLKRRKVTVTGDLIRSLVAETIQAADGIAVQTLLAFEQHGRYIDMRTLAPGPASTEHVRRMIQWIEDKGLTEKLVQGYMKRRKLKTRPEKILTYLAFGMIRKRRNGKYRRRTSYNRLKTRRIYDLYNRIAANMPDEVAKLLRAGLAS